MKRVLFAFLISSFLFPVISYSQINVIRVDNNAMPQTGEGCFYSLPRTVVRIEVRIDRVENYKGPYADYALRYLGLKNVVLANSVEYNISDITISTYPEPDPDQYYFIEMGTKVSKGEKSAILSLNNAGLILGTFPETVDDAVKGAGQFNQNGSSPESSPDAFGELFKYSTDVSVFEKIDTIIKKVSIDTMTIERQFYKRTMVEKSSEQKAKEAADFISKIKDNRFNLISGYQEVNYNRETLEYMDAQLKQLEKDYLKLFTGVNLHKTLTFSFKYIPLPNQINTEIPLFKFSAARGITELDEPGGKVITIKIQRVGNTTMVASYLKRAEKETKVHGFYYRIPELARVTVRLNDFTQEETQCLIDQLGLVTFLPVNKWKVRFHEDTGGIKGLQMD